MLDPLPRADATRSSSRATAVTLLPSSSTRRTACCLNSSVNRRRGRRLRLSVIVDIVSAFQKMSTKPDQVHRHAARSHADVDHTRRGFFEAAEFEAVREALPVALRGVATFPYLTGWRRLVVHQPHTFGSTRTRRADTYGKAQQFT